MSFSNIVKILIELKRYNNEITNKNGYLLEMFTPCFTNFKVF